MPISHGHRPYEYPDYIAPIEANDLISAVDLKQNLYNQGVDSINAKMDQLSGFDIAREQDRIYANQELKKIYQTINSNASADFSSPQVVKSFLDVSKPLERDPRFMNSIQSTRELRTRQKTLADIIAKDPSKYSKANEREYMRDVDKWMADPNAGATLNHKEYTPYKDISKKVTDIVSKMKPDILSQMNDVGKWLTTETTKTLEEEKIKNAVLSQLSADELYQMQIDANFNSELTHPRTKFETVSKALIDTIRYNDTSSRISGIQTKTGYTQAQHSQMAKAAREQLNSLGNIDNLNSMYANAYISNFVNGIGEAYSYKEYTQKLQADPYALMNAKVSAELNAFKQKVAFKHPYDLALVKERNKGKKGVETPINPQDQLKFFGVDFKNTKNIKGMTYDLDFSGSNNFSPTAGYKEFGFDNSPQLYGDNKTSTPALNRGTVVSKILNDAVKNSPSYNEDDWIDQDGDVKDGVTFSYKLNDKGELVYEISRVDDSGKLLTFGKNNTPLKIEVSASDMAKYLPVQGTQGGEELLNTEQLTPDQLELYNQIFGEELF